MPSRGTGRKPVKKPESNYSVYRSLLNEKIVDALFAGKDPDNSDPRTWNWENAHNLCSSVKESDALIERFIKDVGEKYYGMTEERIENCKKELVGIIDEMGFSADKNAMLDFFLAISKQESDMSDIKISNEQLINLINCWADEDLNPGDLRGIGVDKLNHIIFNRNLYGKLNASSDMENYIAAWHDLTFDKSLFEDIAVDLNLVGLGQGQDARIRLRNILFFGDMENPQSADFDMKGKINPYEYIRKRVNTAVQTDNETDDDYTSYGKKLNRKSAEKLLKGLLTNSSLTLNDLKSILNSIDAKG